MEHLDPSEFVHLHLHSEYSLLDGAIRISDLPKLAKEAGHTAVALTDHGNMFGAVAFYRACKEAGIHPIIGCEVYVAPGSRLDRGQVGGISYTHLVLLCENEAGYRNLTYLVSRGYLDGFYGRPRIDRSLLEERHEGLICLSGCLGGEIPRALVRGDYEEAKRVALWSNRVFGDGNFFLEMQDHGSAEDRLVNRGIRRLSGELGIPMVVTNDAHYPKRKDAGTQAVLMCIQTGSVLADGRPLGFETDEYYYKTTQEMEALFPDDSEALRNTSRIAQRCRFDFTFDQLFLPAFRTEDGSRPEDYLRRLAEEGFSEKCAEGKIVFDERYPESVYRERIEYELSVICSMGYAEYYLIVWDFIRFAKGEGIPVGPGRGSGAGSLIAYLIGITEVDSIRFQLMFERFLNPERISMPDFDIDFCDRRRGEVISYVRRRYGEDHVAQIITFGTFAARSSVRDAGRVLGMSYAKVDAVAKAIPLGPGITLGEAKDNPELKRMIEGDEEVRNLIEIALAIEGMPRHASTHAAGVVITDRPVTDYVPLAENSGAPVTQYDMDTIAALGLLKIDFLGLRFLTIMEDAENQIRETVPDFRISEVPLDDRKTYAAISRGDTVGVFQLESRGMRSMLSSLQPSNLEMIIAAISLYRPGPMDSIPTFLENSHDPSRIHYPTPLLSGILDVTFGCIVYQEQVMEICRTLAGYSYARADLVRRAMAKKKTKIMEEERRFFVFGKRDENGNVEIPGAVSLGISEEVANKLYDDMASFAKYAFNKSHATAYALTSYRTAFLKTHYPGAYYSALLTSVSGYQAKTAEYIEEASRNGIPILPPDVNESAEYYHVTDRNGKASIRFGLLAVRKIGLRFVEELMEERKTRGPFADFEDFISRMSRWDCSKQQVEALIKAGAFDSMNLRRSQLLLSYEKIIEDHAGLAKKAASGQMDLFSAFSEETDAAHSDTGMGGYSYPDVPELPVNQLLRMEKEMTGQYFSGHPMDEYADVLNRIRPVTIGELLASFSEESEEGAEESPSDPGSRFSDGQRVTVAGIVTGLNRKVTKKGEEMAFLTVEDRFASMEVVIFPKLFASSSALLFPDSPLLITGEIQAKEDENPRLLASELSSLRNTEGEADTPVRSETEPPAATAETETPFPDNPRILYLRVGNTETDEGFRKAKNLAEIFEGPLPVVFYGTAEAQYRKDLCRGIRLTPFVLGLLIELLGKDNVIVK